jgi:hypothetical protein
MRAIDSPARRDRVTPSATRTTPPCMLSTALLVPCWMAPIMSEISLVDFVVRSASFLTSSATTANPRPCSPARAASIAALSANRFVWSAISLITFTIAEMFSECFPNCSMIPRRLIDRFGNALHLFYRVIDNAPPLFRQAARLHGDLLGRAGVFRNLVDTRCHLLYRRSHSSCGAALLCRNCRETRLAERDTSVAALLTLAAVCCTLRSRAWIDSAILLKLSPTSPQFVGCGHRNTRRKIAARHCCGFSRQVAYGPDDRIVGSAREPY